MQPECTSNEKRHKSVWERETLTKSMKCATSREFDITTTTHTLTRKEERKKVKNKTHYTHIVNEVYVNLLCTEFSCENANSYKNDIATISYDFFSHFFESAFNV